VTSFPIKILATLGMTQASLNHDWNSLLETSISEGNFPSSGYQICLSVGSFKEFLANNESTM
jgi:hypothetical protein